MPTASPFVSTEWLGMRLGDEDVQVIDGSWYLPAQNRDGRAEFLEGHIAGAIFFDVDALADHSTGLPHMLLDETAFAREAGQLGISSDTTLVIYDGSGLFSAPRVWWTFRLFGARAVFILDGGLPKWKAEGRPLDSGTSRAKPTVFKPKLAEGRVADLDAIRAILADGSAQVVDARPSPRFKGEAPEPRPGLESGHMPGSLNVPFSAIVENGALKSPEALRETFAKAGVDLERPIVTSCGSGVSAAIVVLALETIGRPDARLYDGSWSEYASRPDNPIEKG